MTELRKCPFCGGEASQWEFKKLAGRGAEIECIKCQAKIQRVTLKEAIEAWNKRVSCDTCAMYFPDDGCMAGLADGEVAK